MRTGGVDRGTWDGMVGHNPDVGMGWWDMEWEYVGRNGGTWDWGGRNLGTAWGDMRLGRWDERQNTWTMHMGQGT